MLEADSTVAFKNNDNTEYLYLPTGLFRVRGIIHPPGISLLDGPILNPFEVVIVQSREKVLVRGCEKFLPALA